ncbi:MAG: transketolase [Sphaerochaeta sp.]|jgi:transketolase|nr:transketolase [Sphaerochaeta sp.]MDX9915363.1 transketolase [Sphaerochaeta sp.]
MRQELVDDTLIDSLRASTKELRKTLLTMIHAAQSGHPGGSLSASEIVATLYFHELRIKPEDPRWPDRDRFVLSKGHVCPVLYSALALRGYFPYETIYTLRKEGSMLQGHPDMKRCPGIDISTGSLGQGLSTAVGMAIAGKRDGKGYRVFSLVGDGETQEGQIWEALQTASKYKLDNLVVIIDNNNIQNDDTCSVVMPLGDLEAKLNAFGLWTHVIDGHDLVQITSVFDRIRDNDSGLPVAIVAKTVKGKGVSFMEDVTNWHGQAPNDEEFARAMAEIEGESR